MSDAIGLTTAKIYQFPTGGRRSLAVAEVRVDESRAARPVRITSAASWYHEDAIREAELVRLR
jgi:hypothetical protein